MVVPSEYFTNALGVPKMVNVVVAPVQTLKSVAVPHDASAIGCTTKFLGPPVDVSVPIDATTLYAKVPGAVGNEAAGITKLGTVVVPIMPTALVQV